MLKRLLVGLVLFVLLGAAFGLIVRNRLQNAPKSMASKSETAASVDAGQAGDMPEGKAASKSGAERGPTGISADKPAARATSKPKSSLLAKISEKAAAEKPQPNSGGREERPASGGVAAATSSIGKSEASAGKSPAAGEKPTASGAPAVAAKSRTNQDTTVADILDKNPLRNLQGAKSVPDAREGKQGAAAAGGRKSEVDAGVTTGRWPNTETAESADAPPASPSSSAWPQDVASRAAASSLTARNVVDDDPGGTARAKAAAAGGHAPGSAWSSEETKASGNAWADGEAASGPAPPAMPKSRSALPAETDFAPDAASSSFQPPPTAGRSRWPSAGAASLADESDDKRLNELANGVRTRGTGAADEVKPAPRGASGRGARSTDFPSDDEDSYRRNQRSNDLLGNLQKWADGVTGSVGPTVMEDEAYPDAASAGGPIGPTGSEANATESRAGVQPRRSPLADSAARSSAGTNRLLDGNRALDGTLLQGAQQPGAGAAPRGASGVRDAATPRDAGAPREVPRITSSKTGAAPGADQYVVQLNDTYWTIARSQYGMGAYFEALYEHNRARFADPDHLQEGDVLLTPPVEELARRFPNLVPKALMPAELPTVAAAPPRPADSRRNALSADVSPPSAPARASPPGAARTPSDLLRGFGAERTVAIQGGTYSVRPGDTLFTIARQQLGSAARWVELYDLNRDVLGADLKLHPGQQLSLPK